MSQATGGLYMTAAEPETLEAAFQGLAGSLYGSVTLTAELILAPASDDLAAGLASAYSPDVLARTRVYLPTRRACRAMRDAFLRQSDAHALILPRLAPLGALDEDEDIRGPVVKAIDSVVVPVFSGILNVKDALVSMSPVESLSSGRSITFGELIGAFIKSVVLTGGFIGVIGMILFQKRELAATAGES